MRALSFVYAKPGGVRYRASALSPSSVSSSEGSGRFGGVLRVVGDSSRSRAADGDLAGLQRLGHDALQADMEQAQLNVGTLHHDMVRKDETTLERPARNPAIEDFGLPGVGRHTAGHDQRVILDRQVKLFRAKTGYRHRQAIRCRRQSSRYYRED